MTENNTPQTNIFALATEYPNVAELCNALYERELLNLASSHISDPALLKRKLSGLTYHIKNAAEFLLNHPTPIEVDVHNGSWKSKQANKCPARNIDLDKNTAWFSQHLYHGAVICVYHNDFGNEHIELDSVDIMTDDATGFHANKHGWFEFDGSSRDSLNDNQLVHVVKPSKAILSAACSGHTWNSKGKTSPRALSLRELLLSTNINWKTYR